MKRITIIIMLISMSAYVEAQLYIKTFTGYSFSSNPQKMESSTLVDTFKNVYVSEFKNGKGLNLGLSVGYSFNHSFSIEITGNTQIFATQNISIPQLDYRLINNFRMIGYFGDIKYTNTMFQFAPQLMYKIDYKKIIFYLKAGPNFMMVRNKSVYNYIEWDIDTFKWYPKIASSETRSKGGLSIGIQASFGVEYTLSGNTNPFLEFLSVNTRYKPKKSEVVKYEIDGIDHLADLQKTSLTNNDPDRVDFSHVGFNVGIKYVFGRKNKS